MKKLIYALLLFAALIIAFQTINADEAYKSTGAVLSFEELNYDFGKVSEGEVLEHFFRFTNTGKDNLIIQSVQPACGCTGASIGEKKEFLPRESGEIKVTFNTEGREGINSKTISVASNDPNHPGITLSFVCEILKK